MARNATVTCAVALALAVLSGCGTVSNNANSGIIYGGVQADLDAATSVADDAATRIAKPSNLPSGAYFLLIDPPLSVLGDTISLPYTIYQLARKGY